MSVATGYNQEHSEIHVETDAHAIIKMFNDAFNQILPTSKFTQVVECSKDLKFLQ